MTTNCNSEATVNFSSFGLPNLLLNNLQKIGFADPTTIQREAILPQLNGNDILGIAQTGSGKTAAFCIPLLSQILSLGKVRAAKSVMGLILAPTRELATQIEQELRRFAEGSHLAIAVIFGGANRLSQIKRLAKGVDILVATPGRLLDFLKAGAVELTHSQFLVLDEADRMLDMGFIGDIRKIKSFLPIKHQTSFFSATMSPEILKISKEFLQNPIKIGEQRQVKAAALIEQIVYDVRQADKKYLLNNLLNNLPFRSTIIFTRTKHGADALGRILHSAGYGLEIIHGNKTQAARCRALQAFRDGKLKILIATDIAARGIDISTVDLVINYDLPDDADNYVHRIGRTGRNENKGVAVTFYDASKENSKLRAIEKLLRTKLKPIKQKIETNMSPITRLELVATAIKRDDKKVEFSDKKRRYKSKAPRRSGVATSDLGGHAVAPGKSRSKPRSIRRKAQF